MSEATYLLGDTFERMAGLPDASVDLVLTSPPFLALRSYLPPDHPDKAKEIGSEPTPQEFLDTLLRLTAEWGRLITPYGSICVELGDTYAGSGGSGGDYGDGGMKEGQAKWSGTSRAARESDARMAWKGEKQGWPMAKSMCGIPHLYHLSLAYGRNILTGEPSPAGMWRIRNVVAWCRPNPAVGALGDKFRPATSYMTIATKASDRWFDLDAVRTDPLHGFTSGKSARKQTPISGQPTRKTNPVNEQGDRIETNPNGAPPLDHWWEDDDVFEQDAWLVSTESYRGSHYATWPRKLLDRPILAMCPPHVCTTCGEPRRRIVDVQHEPNRTTNGPSSIDRRHIDRGSAGYAVRADRNVETVGWTDCGHNTWRRGHVLDPFGGSGTTAVVATHHGRDCTLIDIDERNIDLARERVGMFLTTEAVA